MATRKEDRAKNPLGGEVAFSDFQIDPAIAKRMVLTDEQHTFIGKIIVHWAQIEADATLALLLLKGHIGSEVEVLAIDNTPLADRIRQILGAATHAPDVAAGLTELIAFADGEKWKRDALAHGSLLFDMDASPSFFLNSRKMTLEWLDIPALEATSAKMRETARRIYTEIIATRKDREGTPLHWMLSQFSTSMSQSI